MSDKIVCTCGNNFKMHDKYCWKCGKENFPIYCCFCGKMLRNLTCVACGRKFQLDGKNVRLSANDLPSTSSSTPSPTTGLCATPSLTHSTTSVPKHYFTMNLADFSTRKSVERNSSAKPNTKKRFQPSQNKKVTINLDLPNIV